MVSLLLLNNSQIYDTSDRAHESKYSQTKGPRAMVATAKVVKIFNKKFHQHLTYETKYSRVD